MRIYSSGLCFRYRSKQKETKVKITLPPSFEHAKTVIFFFKPNYEKQCVLEMNPLKYIINNALFLSGIPELTGER